MFCGLGRGQVAHQRRRVDRVEVVEALLRLGEDGRGEARVGHASARPGHDGVGGHAVLRAGLGHRARQGHDARLGRRVVGLTHRGEDEGLGGGADGTAVDGPTLLLAGLAPVGRGVPQAAEVALHVHPEDRVELILLHVEDHLVATEAGVAHQDIEVAELADGRLEHRLRVVPIGHVAEVRHGFAAGLLDLLDHSRGPGPRPCRCRRPWCRDRSPRSARPAWTAPAPPRGRGRAPRRSRSQLFHPVRTLSLSFELLSKLVGAPD